MTSGNIFDPTSTVPVPAGGFVHRLAHTSHYDGVKGGQPEPAIITICGMGPITLPRRTVGPERQDFEPSKGAWTLAPVPETWLGPRRRPPDLAAGADTSDAHDLRL